MFRLFHNSASKFSKVAQQQVNLSAMQFGIRCLSDGPGVRKVEGDKKRSDYWQDKIRSIEGKVKSGDSTHSAWSAYEEMGIEYETVVAKQWGYISNELAVNLLLKHKKNVSNMIEKKSKTNNKIGILDAGCGTGLVGKYLDKVLTSDTKLTDPVAVSLFKDPSQINITGIDMSPNMAKTASEAVSPCGKRSIYQRCFAQDLDATPYAECNFKNDEFDIIISAGVLPYCKNFDGIIKEWTRILNKNGIIVTSLRTDMTHIAIKAFEKMENAGILKRIELTKPTVHIKDNDTYGSDLKAQFYVAVKQ